MMPTRVKFQRKLHGTNANTLEYCKYEDNEEAYRGNIGYHNIKELLLTESARKRNLIVNSLSTDYKGDKDAGEECDDGHKNAVGYEVEEIEHLEFAENHKLRPFAVTEAGKKTEQKREDKDYQKRRASFKLPLILNCGNDGLHRRN